MHERSDEDDDGGGVGGVGVGGGRGGGDDEEDDEDDDEHMSETGKTRDRSGGLHPSPRGRSLSIKVIC